MTVSKESASSRSKPNRRLYLVSLCVAFSAFILFLFHRRGASMLSSRQLDDPVLMQFIIYKSGIPSTNAFSQDEARWLIDALKFNASSGRQSMTPDSRVFYIRFEFPSASLYTRAEVSTDGCCIAIPIYESLNSKLWGEPTYYTIALENTSPASIRDFAKTAR